MEQELTLPEIIAIIILSLFFLTVALSFFVGIVYIQLEHAFAQIFNRPFYVHLYIRQKRLEEPLVSLMRRYSHFYNRLSPRRKNYFEHRVYRFLNRYHFIGREDFVVTDDVRVRIAVIYVMMTFGMRNYLLDVFERIIIYPSIYLSKQTGEYHKGEFSPAARAVVFSWKDFLEGLQIDNDNYNLAIHEFAHVLHHHGKHGSDVSAGIFAQWFERICAEISRPANRERLLTSDYFRKYAHTNVFEFLAVILEHYFETPETFRQTFPELYSHVSRMLNHKHQLRQALPI